MPNPDLWTAIKDAGRPASLSAFALEEGTDRKKNSGHRQLTLGVDMRTIVADCAATINKLRITEPYPGGELRIFFFRLSVWLTSPMTLVFVFEQPEINDPWWRPLAQELIKYFGYYSIEVDGKSSIELANLNKEGIIDAIITNNSDALVFGAFCVIRWIPGRNRFCCDDVDIFQSETVNANLGLTQDALILFALLAGNFDHQGVPGFGTSISLGLARCGFGEGLMDAVRTLSPAQLEAFRIFAGFRAGIQQELATNSQGFFASRYEKLSEHLPESFPNQQILDIYSHSPKSSAFGHCAGEWKHREPSISHLAKFGQENFEWNTEERLKREMSSNVWEGAFLQMLYSKFVIYSKISQQLATPYKYAKILEAKRVQQFTMDGMDGTPQGDPEPRLLVSVDNFTRLMNASVRMDDLEPMTVWVPEVFLPHSLLEELDFEHSGDSEVGIIDLTEDD